MQDVVPKESRSIRNVSIQRSRRRVSRPYEDEPVAEENTTHDAPPPRKPPTKKRTRRGSGGFMSKLIIGIAVVVIIVLVGMMLFSGAKVTVVVREAPVFLDALFEVSKDSTAGLTYDELEVTAEKTTTIPAIGTEEVNTRASGEIIIFNSFGSAPQKLITNTRFESPDGLIYRIDRSVVVPGTTKDASGKTIPGSLTVTVYADFPGEEYNIGLTDFTVPGLKSDADRYKAIYARSKTNMSGGFAGVRNVADEAELRAAQAALQTELRESARQQLLAQVPEGFVTFDSALFEYFTSTTDGSGSNTVTVKETLQLKALIFDETAFARRIAEETVADYEDTEINVRDWNEVIVTMPEVEEQTGDALTLLVSGSPHLVWTFDEDALRTDLAGQDKDDVDTILEGYPGIETAEIIVRPFWNSTLPERTSRIKIKTQQEAE